jgi:hypothetical protein
MIARIDAPDRRGRRVCLQLSAYLNSPDSCLSNITGTVRIRVINPTMTAKGTAKVENTSPSEGPTRCAVPPKIKAEIDASALYTRKGIYSKMKVVTKATTTIATELINQARMKGGQLRVRHAFWSKSSVSGINRNILNIMLAPVARSKRDITGVPLSPPKALRTSLWVRWHAFD